MQLSLRSKAALASPAVCAARTTAPVRRVVMCRVEKDTVKAAADLLSMGLNALKQVDTDKLKSTASGASANAAGLAEAGAGAVKAGLDAAMGTFAKYDKDGDGKLSISEAVALMNSPEVAEIVSKTTGQPHTQRTEEDIQKWFKRADFDHSGTLSKREFVVCYIGLLADKAKVGAGGLASMLCAALDADGDGKIESSELKRLLKGSGLSLISNVASLIPDGKEVDYRSLLSKVA